MRIFLSYGHDDYASLALRIKHDLELGHGVWFDLDRLKPGGDWERYIEDGLDFASAVPNAGCFLLLMTPHSVRRPDGYCLNELARAFDRNLPVIPVMVSTVEPPLSISRLQWLDMRNCFPAELHEEPYRKQYGKLVKALEEKQVPFEGAQQRLLNYLQPITYADDLRRHLSRFTGREWLMVEVKQWLESRKQILWITGEAGVGKSAVAAWLCHKRPEIAAYHFCHFGNSDRTNARRTLFSLAYQLGTQLPVYRDRLNSSSLDKITVETNVPAIFDQLFVNLLSDAVPPTDNPHVLLIDALDEATSNGKNELASLIGHEFKRLPLWFRAIVTSRPYEKEINFACQALDPWKLDAGREENVGDIRAYLDRELRRFTGDGPPPESTVQQIITKSEHLFLYVSWVRQELEDGHLSLKDVEKFPQGLGGIYGEFFQRYFPDLHEYETLCRPALEAICAVREPIERNSLASLLGRSEYEMRQLIARLGSLFPVVDGVVRSFHQTVRDWLVDPDRSGDYWIDASAQEQRLADLAWREYAGGVNTMGQYCIKYAPFHFVRCKKKDALKKLLLDPEWVQAKLRVSGVVPLLADYGLALDALCPESSADMSLKDDVEIGAMQMIQEALRLSSHVIGEDPSQFPSQMVGRLLPHENLPPIKKFSTRITEGAARRWLRPLQANLHPPGTALLRTLQGHTGAVHGVAVTGDGRRAVSASADQTLKVWDVETGRELRTLKGHSSSVFGVALSGDGRLGVSASQDQTLKVWDVETGRELRTVQGHRGAVHGVAVTGDGRRAVSASADQTLKVWDVETGRELRTLKGHGSSVLGVALSGDGRLAVSASDDTTLKVWDIETGRELVTLHGHTGGVHGVAVTGDGRLAVSASADQSLKVWDVETGRELRTLEGHTDLVRGVAVGVDEHRAVSASSDHTLKLWDVDTGGLIAAFTCDGPAYCCEFVGVDQFIAGDAGGHVHFLRLEESRPKD